MESSPWRIALGKAHRLRSSKRAALISASTMQLLKRESWHLLLLVCLLLLLRTTAEAARKNNSDGNGVEDADAQQHQEQFRDIQSVPYLVEMIGNKLYAFVNRPKYKVSNWCMPLSSVVVTSAFRFASRRFSISRY